MAAEAERVLEFLKLGQTVVLRDNTWRLDDFVRFANPVLFLLSEDRKELFLITYWAATAFFYLMIFTLIIFGNHLHDQLMNSVTTEGFKFVIKSSQLLMFLFITVAQIPFITLLFQGFLCEENPL
jgi:hypothetical protein